MLLGKKCFIKLTFGSLITLWDTSVLMPTKLCSISTMMKQPKGVQKTILNYAAAAGILTIGLTYAAVPLYRMFCQVCNI